MLDRLKHPARTIKRDVHAVYLAAGDPRTPWYARALALCIAGYALSPIDLIPDFIPVFGYLDDVIIVPLGILAVVKMIPPEVMAAPSGGGFRWTASRESNRCSGHRKLMGSGVRTGSVARVSLSPQLNFNLKSAVHNMRPFLRIIAASPIAGLAIAAVATGPAAGAEALFASQLKEQTHIHGLAVDRQDPEKLLIATHHGLFRSGPDGKAELISPAQDFMGFTPDPSDVKTLYGSGHPVGGGNLGFIASTDNGVTWEQVAPGVGGPVDFHQLTASSANPQVLYGAYGALQMSRDGGKSWSMVGVLPERLIDLAASAGSSETLYAATERGLLVSKDGGQNWETVLDGAPVSLVEVAADGSVYAFVLGRGFVGSAEPDIDFKTISDGWGDRILLHLAVDPADKNRIFAASQQGDILASTDGGASWTKFGQ